MTSKRLLTAKQGKLIVLSSIADSGDYLNLINHLSEGKGLTEKHILENSTLNLVKSNYVELLNASKIEWSPLTLRSVDDLGDDFKKKKIKCTLCGSVIRYKHRLKNNLKPVEIIVGSECVKEFGDEIQSRFKSQREALDRAKVKEEIESLYPGLLEIIDTEDLFLKQLPFTLSLTSEGNYLQAMRALKECVQKCLRTSKGVDAIKRPWTAFNTLKRAIEKESDRKKDHPHALTKEHREWLVRNRANEVLEMIKKEDGLITKKTVHRLKHPDLVSRYIKLAQPLVLNKDLKISGILSGKSEVVITFKKGSKEVVGHVPYGDFMIEVAQEIFERTPMKLDFEELFAGAKHSKDTQLKMIQSLVSRSSFKIEYSSRKASEVILSKDERIYYLIKYDQFTDLKAKYFEDGKTDEIMNKLIINGRKMTVKQFKMYEELDKDSKKLMKSNREK